MAKKTKRKVKKMRKKKPKKIIKKPISKVAWLFAILILVAIISVLGLGLLEYLNLKDYVEADVIRVKDSVIILGENCTAIVAETSPERARSIEHGLEGKIDVRPNTHDIFADTLKKFDITLEAVTLDKFEDNIYYANLNLRKDNVVLKIDTKPSDGIALALRMKSPIYIKREILEKMGGNIC